jgi:hypothetical protein
MQRLKVLLHIAAVLVLVALMVVPVSQQLLSKPVAPQPVANSGSVAKKPKIPTGLQVYQVAQAAEVWPKILQTTIDPPDVHVGMTQTLEVVVQSKDPIVSVVAKITTDTGVDEVPLTYVEQVAIGDSDQRIQVGANNQLVLPGTPEFAAISKARADETYPKSRYRGTWLVHSTHDTTYHTTFVVKDQSGAQSEVTMAWTDACGIPAGGDFTLASPCTISAPDGVDNGNVTINDSLTLNANFAFNSGKTFTVGSGSISVCSGCEIQKTNIWVTDADGDTYPGAGMTLATSNPGGGTRRYLASGTTDCYDANANAHPNLAGYLYFATNRGDGSFDYDCSGSEEQETKYQDYCDWGTGSPSCAQAPYTPGYSCGTQISYDTSCSATMDYCTFSNLYDNVTCH